ncbi:Smr/MutS family protein [Parafilimonas terrae]|uniref:Smr domain-containing protein n=1 Tax=Parafilimonas terrae TaxID=1465490 RepID=A0A1I5WHT2_9BACT|nr:Smr/MutS family protein [Parafilimonas terrae]SFQ19199.1 Smr domain-containing protein [Parafilimonas terrae]
MKYQPGDDIIILHTNEEGKVAEIINNKMLLVEVRGVRFPVYTDQVDFPYFKRFTSKRNTPAKKPAKKYIDDIPKEKKQVQQTVREEGVWLSFIPKFTMDEFGDEVVELFKLYLINKNTIGYKFQYIQGFFGNEEFELKGDILMRNDFYLHDIPFSDFNDNPFFNFEFSLITPEKNKAEYYETSIKLKPKQLFQRIEEMKDKNEPSINFKLFDVYPEKAIEESVELTPNILKKNKLYQAERIREHLEPARSVVDLHMEKLSDDWQHLSNFEILTLQLKEFEKWYELALAHHLPSFTVIHGVGSGKLRDEIHDILKTKKEVKTFINQYHPRYGYGATEIYFQY